MSVFAALALLAASQHASFTPLEIVRGDVRVQAITPSLIRIERRGPYGFEDRKTFTVVQRPGGFRKVDGARLEVGAYSVVVPEHGDASDVKIVDGSGATVYQWDGKPIAHAYLPAPGEAFAAWAFADNPRIVPPSWGATPPPAGNAEHPETSGWDTTNDAPDIYVFLPGTDGYAGLRRDFLDVTGHTPMPPLAAFGFWDSRYYEYKQKEALNLIDDYRRRGYPLDFFVVDTDWRVNGSHGYQIETKDFPDMAKFIAEAHKRHVHLMYNDHPEPVSPSALDPKEFEYRWKGLTELLDMGADVWWYDRNWSTHLHEPAPGIAKEVWGARVFHDITQRARPNQRPLLMSNVEGIDNGKRSHAPHPAFHRFPIWWTGDTGAYFSYLQMGIENGVDSGVQSLLPYVNEDLGGHWAHPTPELYVRYLQYGTLSPITRIHCTKGEDRHPWIFGEEAEGIVKRFIKLRYRLLPTIYAASRRAYEDGTPLMRRCDLEWPTYREAADNHQFLLGDDILVAPTDEGVLPRAEIVPKEILHAPNGAVGLQGEYFANPELKGKPALTRIDEDLDFDWKGGSPAPGIPRQDFSVRWTGKWGPMPETGDYTIDVRSDDGFRLYINGRDVMEDWRGRSEMATWKKIHFEKGQVVDVRLEYFQGVGDDTVHFEWVLPSQVRKVATRTLWVPPGQWEDLWTGEVVEGPKQLTVESPLWHCPMYVRRGGIVLLAPEMRYTSEKPWDPVTAEFYPADGVTVTRHLYEDDGKSNDYLASGHRVTSLTGSHNGKHVQVDIGPAVGSYNSAPAKRGWVLRVHLLPGESAKTVELDGRAVAHHLVKPGSTHVEIPFQGAGSAPGPSAGAVLEVRVPPAPAEQGHRLAIEMD